MTSEQVGKLIEAGRIVAILRGAFGGREEDLTAVLLEAGITAVEVTLNSPDALATIERLARRFGTTAAVGAGTVLRADEVKQAADAGARFIVSPNRDGAVIAATKRSNLFSLPGCFTPSEIVEALDAGADAIKIFPANLLGPAYIKAVRAPLNDARLAPTGGVTPDKAREYFAAGAWAVGVGAELVGQDILQDGGFALLRARATAFVKAATTIR